MTTTMLEWVKSQRLTRTQTVVFYYVLYIFLYLTSPQLILRLQFPSLLRFDWNFTTIITSYYYYYYNYNYNNNDYDFLSTDRTETLHRENADWPRR